jgi:plasmid stabilization system protein ParE
MVIWSKLAQVQLKKAFHFISNDSPQNAEKIINNLIDITLGLSENPEIYPADKSSNL